MKRLIRNIIRGAGSILILFPRPYYKKKYTRPFTDDMEAIASDWETIGKDFRLAQKNKGGKA
jgi:hypothetical protein